MKSAKPVLAPAIGVVGCGLAALLAVTLASPAARAVSGGDLDVMPKGRYVCEVSGDASDPGIAGGRHQPESDFAVLGDSSYRSRGATGVYLLIGDRLTMTTGPLRGRRFRRVDNSFVRELQPDGSDGLLRCIASIQAIGLEPPDGRRCKEQRPQDAVALLDGKPRPSC